MASNLTNDEINSLVRRASGCDRNSDRNCNCDSKCNCNNRPDIPNISDNCDNCDNFDNDRKCKCFCLIEGPEGPRGPKGNVGDSLKILGTFANSSELPITANSGDAYLIGKDL